MMIESVEALNKIGISVRNEQGNFRPFKDVLDDIAKVWNDKLNRKEDNILKSYIATKLVGIKDRNKFIELINNKKGER